MTIERSVQVLKRVFDVISQCEQAQYATSFARPRGKHRVAIGQYPSHLDFSLYKDPDESRAWFKDVEEANGSSFMGLWFLSACVPLLRDELERWTSLEGTNSLVLDESSALVEDSIRSVSLQLQRAAELPMFFQGGTEEGMANDIHDCPDFTMGWYPLVEGYRLPAVIPECVESLLDWFNGWTSKDMYAGMANLTDGDIWSWCMAIDETTPGVLRYLGLDALREQSIYRPLLRSYLRETYSIQDPQTWNNQDSLVLWEHFGLHDEANALGHEAVFPLQTFYRPDRGPRGGFSCAVMANVLASIPLLGLPQGGLLDDVRVACRLVEQALASTLDGQLTWKDFAYDYYTIRTAPVGYVTRAHQTIERLRQSRPGLTDFPALLSASVLEQVAHYVAEQCIALLHLDVEHFIAQDVGMGSFHGNMDYATLIYAFLAMGHIGEVSPELYQRVFCEPVKGDKDERWLVERVLEWLLIDNPDVSDTPGTGPYRLFGSDRLSANVTKSSICFVLPPLAEALLLYNRQSVLRRVAT